MSTERKVTHSTFSIERTLKHPPAKIWAAFATKETKAKWFSGTEDGWKVESWDLDFRIGGKETNLSRAPNGGPRVAFEARYYDLLPNQRLVYAYEMHLDDNRISVSLSTIELHPDGKGTRLVLTEQGAYLDGFDNPKLREDGTNGLLDKLTATLDG
jgi:uncharacterized protein YndB with AHSA1/START domain